MRPVVRRILGLSLLADLAFVAVGVLVWRGMQPAEEVAQLIAGNPGWTVDASADWLVLTENATQRRVVLAPDQAGPHVVRHVPCAEVEKAYPAWFRVPGDSSETEPLACVHVAGPELDAYVVNVLTALEIPKVWDELYAPLVEQAKVGATGGHATGGGGAQRLGRETVLGKAVRPPLPGASGPRGSAHLSYSIDPTSGSAERETRLHATHVGDETLLVASFRRPPR